MVGVYRFWKLDALIESAYQASSVSMGRIITVYYPKKLEKKKQLTDCLWSKYEGFRAVFFMPKRVSYQNIPQAFQIVKQEKSFGLDIF